MSTAASRRETFKDFQESITHLPLDDIMDDLALIEHEDFSLIRTLTQLLYLNDIRERFPAVFEAAGDLIDNHLEDTSEGMDLIDALFIIHSDPS
ncbi:hypothetical protein [Paeniglutamicibacter sp.]|uniref:hypothetical protein n=1 Tax=Paeniglutamicibacter sp. TaxID=1934391 RepID=UPI0039892012